MPRTQDNVKYDALKEGLVAACPRTNRSIFLDTDGLTDCWGRVKSTDRWSCDAASADATLPAVMPWLPAGETRIYYQAQGTGPPLVFAHGAGG
jgi:hypothetical protein